MARKKNQGRRYEADEWLEFMLEGTLEGEKQAVRDGEHEVSADCYDTVYEIRVDDIEISGDLQKVKEAFERDVRKAITEWVGQYRLAEDWDVDDIMDAGAVYDVYTALDGSGAGDINYGEWDKYFTDSDYWENETLITFLKERVGKYIDDTGGGKLSNEMSNAVYEAFVEVCDVAEENPSPEEKERRRQRTARAEKSKAKRRKKRGKRRRRNPAPFGVGEMVDVTLTVPKFISPSEQADVVGEVLDTWEDEEGSNVAVMLEGPDVMVVLRQAPGEEPLWWLADEVSVTIENPSNPRIVPEEIRVRSIRPGMSEEEEREEEKRNETIRQWIRETATPQAILRGEREEVVIPERREPVEGRRRIYAPEKRAPNPGVTPGDLVAEVEVLMPTEAQIRSALDSLSWPSGSKRSVGAYLRSTEHYDVSDEGETKADWIEEAAGGYGDTAYIVGINTGGFTGDTVAVLAQNADTALETADEWAATRYYEGDSEKMHGAWEGAVRVEELLVPMSNPKTVKTFKTGTVVKHTGKFLRSIGSVSAPVDGLVLGSNGDRLLVAWSDGRTNQVHAGNVQKARKQMGSPEAAKATVTAERERARQTMDTGTWTPEEIDEVVAYYPRDDLAANPRRSNPAPPPTTQGLLVERLKF